MKTSESIIEVAKALLGVQNEFTVIAKRSKGNKGNFAKYDDLIAKAKPILTKAGLLLMQPLGFLDGGQSVITIIIHAETGEFIQTETPIQMMDVKNRDGVSTLNESMQAGGGISYTKRYSLGAILAWATGDYDLDQGTLDKQSEFVDSVFSKIAEITTEEDLQKHFKANERNVDRPALIKACADRKKELQEASNAGS